MSNKNEYESAVDKFKKNQKNRELRKDVVIQAVKITGKAGRPTDKDPEKKYVKISAVVEMGTKKLMGQALYSYLAETHKTQNDLINTAILEYLKKHKK